MVLEQFERNRVFFVRTIWRLEQLHSINFRFSELRTHQLISQQIADIGDVPLNTFNLLASVKIIEDFYKEKILSFSCTPLTMGGDHTIALPILRAMKSVYGPLSLIHVDAHADINDTMFGEKIAHGTPFRRAVEEGLLDTHSVVQIGLRGTGYAADDFDWSRKQGFRVVQAGT